MTCTTLLKESPVMAASTAKPADVSKNVERFSANIPCLLLALRRFEFLVDLCAPKWCSVFGGSRPSVADKDRRPSRRHVKHVSLVKVLNGLILFPIRET